MNYSLFSKNTYICHEEQIKIVYSMQHSNVRLGFILINHINTFDFDVLMDFVLVLILIERLFFKWLSCHSTRELE